MKEGEEAADLWVRGIEKLFYLVPVELDHDWIRSPILYPPLLGLGTIEIIQWLS